MTTSRWQRRWAERMVEPLELVRVRQSEQLDRLQDRTVDLCFVRETVRRDGLHLIPLYEESAVLVVPADHPATVLDLVHRAELDAEPLLELGDSAAEQDRAFDLVAGGAGVLIVPQSIARSHSRRDLGHVPVADIEPTSVGLAWLVENTDPLIEQFIGIVRGRTVNSSRSQRPTRTPKHR